MADKSEPAGFNGNMTMMFSSGAKEDFTKTPANAPSGFIVKPAAPTTSNKRKVSGSGSSNGETPKSTAKKAKIAPTTSSANSTSFAKSSTAKLFEKAIQPAALNKKGGNTTTEEQAFGSPKEKGKRRVLKKAIDSRKIARSIEECSEEDKALITMRDEGKSWADIRAKIEELTGNAPGISTLPNRYARIKSNFAVIAEEDQALLLQAKNEVEDSFDNQKWELIARVVQEKGGNVHSAETLQLVYKKLMMQEGVMPPSMVRDKDFEIEIPSDLEDGSTIGS